MKNFEIKITGSGTKNMIEVRLLTIVREIQTMTEAELYGGNGITPFFEDSVLCCVIKDSN